MKKQTMLNGTMIMIGVGFITKMLSMANRIVITRALGEVGIGVYMLISPTIMLLATLTTIGLPVAIPVLVARGEMKERKVLFTAVFITSTISIAITLLMFMTARPLATYMFKDDRTYLPLLFVGPLLFFVGITAIIKSYFQGKENMIPSAVSTLVEQIVRMTLSIVFIALALPRGINYAVVGLMLASIIGEIVSTCILLMTFIKFKNKHYPKSTFEIPKLERTYFKDILSISLPTTGSRLIGTVSHFLEPIIIVRALFHMGYAAAESTRLYGVISGFVVPILFLPSFISSAVTQTLIPVVSKAYNRGDFNAIHRRLSLSFRIAFLTSGFYLMFVMLFPEEIMQILYDSASGTYVLLAMAPAFLLLYFQAPMVATLQVIGEARFAVKAGLVASILRIVTMSALMLIPGLNIWGLVISIVLNIILLTTCYYVIVSKRVGYQMKIHKIVNGGLLLGVAYMLGKHLRALLVFEHQMVELVVIGLILFGVHAFGSVLMGLFPRPGN